MPTNLNGFVIFGAIEQKWIATGGQGGFLGLPLSNETPTFDNVGRFQLFTGGVVSWHPEIGAFTIIGLIGARWASLGKEQFGYPVTDELTTQDRRGRFNHFRAMHLPGRPDSSIFWHPDTGAHEVFGGIRDRWAALGWERGVMGYPNSHELPTFDGVGRFQTFTGGTISWHPDTGAHGVWGLISERWWQLGREQFGYPITDEMITPDGKGRYNHFRSMHVPGTPDCSIYWHPDTGAHEVFGGIRDRWAALGWERGVMGYPNSHELPTFDGVGRFQTFTGGTISWHPDTGAHGVWGLISERWWQLGREQFGYPITDEMTTPDGKGRYNHFRSMHVPGTPDCSIYWHPETGAHEVYGAIRERWAAIGWELSALGYPRSGERDRPGGGRIQDFQYGSMGWTPAQGAFIEWVRRRQTITTPPGTALGGWAELELRRDGSYNFRGHMHGSGFDPYKFRVRAVISSTAGVALVAQKSGDVEGTLNGGFDPRRDFDWDDPGHSSLINAEWADLDFRTFAVAKSYEDTGVLGAVESVAMDVLSFLVTDLAMGPHVALAIFIGNELTEITGTPFIGIGGLTGTVVVAGSSWLLGPGFAIPIFIGTALVTTATVKQRKISDTEYEFASVVFGDTLPPKEHIFLTNLSGLGGRAFVAPNVDGSILVNLSDEIYSQSVGPMRATKAGYSVPGQVLIHELTHAWQLARNGFVPGYVCSGATSSNYNPPPAGSNWESDFNLEQEGATVDRWFGRHAGGWTNVSNLRSLLESPGAIRDPYFQYIERNIRMAED